MDVVDVAAGLASTDPSGGLPPERHRGRIRRGVHRLGTPAGTPFGTPFGTGVAEPTRVRRRRHAAFRAGSAPAERPEKRRRLAARAGVASDAASVGSDARDDDPSCSRATPDCCPASECPAPTTPPPRRAHHPSRGAHDGRARPHELLSHGDIDAMPDRRGRLRGAFRGGGAFIRERASVRVDVAAKERREGIKVSR